MGATRQLVVSSDTEDLLYVFDEPNDGIAWIIYTLNGPGSRTAQHHACGE